MSIFKYLVTASKQKRTAVYFFENLGGYNGKILINELKTFKKENQENEDNLESVSVRDLNKYANILSKDNLLKQVDKDTLLLNPHMFNISYDFYHDVYDLWDSLP